MKNRTLHLFYGSLLALSIGLNVFAFLGREPEDSTPIATGKAEPVEYRTLRVDETDSPNPSGPSSLAEQAGAQAEVVELRKQIAAVRSRHQVRAEKAYAQTSEGVTPDGDILLGGGSHGITPEKVVIGRKPDSAKSLDSFLPGTIWSWASIDGNSERASDLGEYVIFLEDGTMFGSWGLRYSFSVTEDLSVEWWGHRLTFGKDFQGFRVDGKNKRIGRLLQSVEEDELNDVFGAVSNVHVVYPDDKYGRPENLADKVK
jgi:hypothetical protein